MRVWSWRLSTVAAVFGVGMSAGVAACSSTTTTPGVVPVTGITIPAATLTTGIGCGTGAGQIYKYAAVVSDPPLGAVYDCFADAAFVNLVATVDGGALYTVDVFLYDQDAYNLNASQINGAVGASNALSILETIPSTFTTSCTATQTGNLQTVAQCTRVAAAGPGSVQIKTDSFSLADGGAFACNSGYNGVIGGAFGLDAGLLLDSGTAPSVSCPNVLTVGPFPGLTQVDAPVTLLNGLTPIATTTCHATITPNATTPATCDPLALP